MNTINNIKDNTHHPFRVRILNNGYLDEDIREYLSFLSKDENFTIMYSDDNLGCPPGRHKLLKDIQTPYAMTLDDDMYVTDSWLDRTLDLFDQNPSIGVVGIPYSQLHNGNVRGGGSISISNSVVSYNPIDWSAASYSDPYVIANDVPGGSMIMRTEVLDDFQWDPRYKLGFGDLDKSLQLMESSWLQAMASDIQFTHAITNDNSYMRVRKDYQERRESYYKFIDKWGYRYPFKKHIIYKYAFALPWPIMNTIEEVYKWVKNNRPL